MSRAKRPLTPAEAEIPDIVIQAPASVMVEPPDTTALVRVYKEEILPLAKYTIRTPDEYVQSNLDWTRAKNFAARVDELFAPACDLAFRAHRAITGLREAIKAPGEQIAQHVGAEILRYRNEQNRLRAIEEARRQAEEDRRREAERRRLEAEANAERERLIAERREAIARICEWDVDDDYQASLPEVPEPVAVVLPEAAPVRLPSSIPVVMGGPRLVDKPMVCRITDPVALLRWIIEKPEERLLNCIEFKSAWLNRKAVELGPDMERVIPGTEAVREQGLRRA